MPRYTEADANKMYWGILQKDAGLRRATHLIRAAWLEKPGEIEKFFPLPFDRKKTEEEIKDENQELVKRLKERNKEFKKQLENGG